MIDRNRSIDFLLFNLMDRFSYISKRKRLLSLGSTIEKKETLGMALQSIKKEEQDNKLKENTVK